MTADAAALMGRFWEGNMATILVVDDDSHIREVLSYALKQEGHQVRVAENGEEGLRMARESDVELIVLDIMMPEMDGLEVCRELRRNSDTPIIFLSSKSDEVDRIVGLELGGDDYISKPFSPRELVARVRAVLRRRGSAARPNTPAKSAALNVGPVSIDDERHEVRCGGELLQLTVTEYAVLRTLLGKPGRVYSRAKLVDVIYSIGHHITERTIDTHVRRIRAKFKPYGYDPIDTVFGVGYRAREE
jgi:two-component system, OmpR family, response regulator